MLGVAILQAIICGTMSAIILTSSICQEVEVLVGVNAEPAAIGVTTASVDPLTISNSRVIGAHTTGINLLCANSPRRGLKHAWTRVPDAILGRCAIS